MDWIAFARALHVLGVVHWIGGVAMVTMVILPAVRRTADPHAMLPLFEAVEGRFARQARISVAIVGLSGLYMVQTLGLWDRFTDPAFWWLHAMVLLWAIFAFVLYIAEPLFLHARFRQRAQADPIGKVTFMLRAHRVLLTASLLTVGAAVLGAHGGL